MHGTDEQLREIMRRAETVKERRSMRKRLLGSAAASGVCAALLIAVCFCLPQLAVMSWRTGIQQYGSLLLAAPYMGCVVVGVLAFALGVCVTLVCIHWRALRQREQEGK